MELYEAANLPRVLASKARLIGINNRDLRTFETSLEHTLTLAPRLPADACPVSESGIRSRADVLRLRQAGVRAVLVGETLMRAPTSAPNSTNCVAKRLGSRAGLEADCRAPRGGFLVPTLCVGTHVWTLCVLSSAAS